MNDSSKTPKKGKPTLPPKPYEAYPLFAHQSGRWAKKVKQKIRFYGRWGRIVDGKMTPVENQDKAAADALAEFNRCWPFHSQGREAPPIGSGSYVSLLDLVNKFLENKEERMKNGELSVHSYEGYYRLCSLLIDHFGKTQRIDVLTPADFQKLRSVLAKDSSLVTLRNRVNLARVLFKYAYDERLIDRPVYFGQSFERPTATKLRAAKNSLGPKMFAREEILMMLDALEGKPIVVEGKDKPVKITPSSSMRAMILLGVNAGFGNTDVSSLKMSSVDLKSGWIAFPRPKTEVNRRVPLWPETLEALKLAFAERSEAASLEEGELCFLTKYGTRFVRTQPSIRTEGRFITINGVARRFAELLDALKIGQRKGIGFYTLRHVFETIGGGSRDQVALDSIMGHTDPSMAGQYRQYIDDERLLAVVNHVRNWLWPAE